jgi:hypothetical protein
MVWRRMGLLDDAIRDHLELKRLRGADPGEVAREQREALEPDLRGEPVAGGEELATAVEHPGAEHNGETLPVRPSPAVTPTSTADPVRAPQPAHTPHSSEVAEETAELDMQRVLGENEGGAAEAGSSASAAAAGSGGDSPSLASPSEDQLEWEVPGDSSGEMPLDAGQNDPAVGDDGH